MCGFAGMLARRSDRPVGSPHELRDVLERMSERLAHRGPDDRGLFLSPTCGLAHRRLSVIDLSRAGRQPMASDDGRVQVVFNGELYNFRELRDEFGLDDRGYRFRSRSDTEVILHLYQELGIECLEHFDGMFALAIWDDRTRTLHLARDPFGVKPLFTLEHDGRLWFASEIKALLAVPGFSAEPSREALHHYLGLAYIPGELTAFEGIGELAPGERLEVRVDRDAIHRDRFFQLDHDPLASTDRRELAARTLELLEAAVRRQLVSDVPVGVMLSGGIDSSALAALAVKVRGNADIDTFSLAFDDTDFDESAAARRVAEHLGTRHHEIKVTPDRVRELLPACLAGIDEPYADGSAIPTWLLAERARDHVTVLLSGEGGDELLAGYDTHAAARAREWYRLVPGPIRRWVIRPLVNRLPVSHRKLSFEFKAKRFARGAELGVPESHYSWREVMSEDLRRELLTGSDGRDGLRSTESLFVERYEACAALDPLDRLLAVDAGLFLPDDLMVKNDRMTMVHSLEARVPFTDVALVRFLARVPARCKLRRLTGKVLLREALAGLLPPEIIRKPKVGLEMPYSSWLLGPLRELAGDVLLGGGVRETGLFCEDVIGRLWSEHQQRVADHGRPLWSLLNYLLWHDLYIGRGNFEQHLPAPRPARVVDARASEEGSS